MFSPIYKPLTWTLLLKHEQNKSVHQQINPRRKQMKSLVYLTFAIVFGTGMIASAFNAANQLKESGEGIQRHYETRYEAYK